MVPWNSFSQVLNELSSDRLCSGGSIFLLVFTRHCKLQQAWNVKRWRKLSVDVCGNFLLRISLNTGMWGAAAREAACPLQCHRATSGSVGRTGQCKHWPHAFLGCDFTETLNKGSASFKMGTELIIAFLQVLNVQMWTSCLVQYWNNEVESYVWAAACGGSLLLVVFQMKMMNEYTHLFL